VKGWVKLWQLWCQVREHRTQNYDSFGVKCGSTVHKIMTALVSSVGAQYTKLWQLWCQVREHSTQNPWLNLRKRSCLTLEHEGATILHSVTNHLSSETVSHSQVQWNYITKTASSPRTEHPETAICEGLIAVTMMMSINFWNIMPKFQMNMLPPSPFRHTKACTSGGHAFSWLS
jgi:hypothetical protein